MNGTILDAFWREEEGATAVEYGLIVSLMILVMIVGINSFAEAMTDMYSDSDDSIRATIDNAGQ